MWPIYGLGAIQLELLHNTAIYLPLKALLMMPVIYANEFFWGFVLHKFTGKRIWDYGAGKHTFMGYIRWDMAHWWYLLAVTFEIIADKLYKLFDVINTVL